MAPYEETWRQHARSMGATLDMLDRRVLLAQRVEYWRKTGLGWPMPRWW